MTALPMRFAAVPVPTYPQSRLMLAARWLTPEEEAHCPHRAVEKRRAEFTAGRIAAKLAVARFRGTPSISTESRIGVANGLDAGRPIVTDQFGSRVGDVALSITHADGLAIAAAGATELGIDLVSIVDQGKAFATEAFLPGELSAWRRWTPRGEGAAFAPSIAFGAKEAVLKWLGVGLRMSLRHVSVWPAPAEVRVHCHDLNVPAVPFRIEVELRHEGHGKSARGLSLRSWVMRVADQLLIVASPNASHCEV